MTVLATFLNSKVEPVNVLALISSLNVAVMAEPVLTAVAELTGLVAVTVGGLVSGAVLGVKTTSTQ